jgi:hypothetical protein
MMGLLTTKLKNWRHWIMLLKSNVTHNLRDWLTSMDLDSYILIELVWSTWLASIKIRKGLLVWDEIRQVRECTRSWCSKTYERRVEHCLIWRIGWMRIQNEGKVIGDWSSIGFRLMIHNFVPSVSSLRLGQLGFHSSSLLVSSHR